MRTFCIVLLALALAACTRITTGNTPTQTHHNPWTIPGLLRIGGTQQLDNLNPMLGTLGPDIDVGSFWCARLFVYDDHEVLQPELAVVEPTLANRGISQDGKTIIYHLRHGVRWHDGQPFSAADVVFSWRQAINPDNGIASHYGYEVVQRVDAPDAYTAVVHLRHPFAPFVSAFFTSQCVLPKHILQGYPNISKAPYNRLPIGTGAFKVIENQPGVVVRLVANKDYWRGPPRLREIDYHMIPSGITLLTQLRSHDIDFYPRAPAVATPQLATITGTTIYRHFFSAFYDLGFNMAHAPLDDLRVRQALVYALDMPHILAVSSHGINAPADSDQPSWRWSHATNLRHYRYDPVRARRLLDDAGWRVGPRGVRQRNGASLELALVGVVGNSTEEAAELVMQDEWRAIGAAVTIKNVPTAVMYAPRTGIEQSGAFDLSFEATRQSADPDDDSLYGCAMTPPHGWNTYHYCNPLIDREELIARSSYDRNVRKAAYAKIQRALLQDLPFYVLWFNGDQDVANTDLQGYRAGTTSSIFWNVWQWSI